MSVRVSVSVNLYISVDRCACQYAGGPVCTSVGVRPVCEHGRIYVYLCTCVYLQTRVISVCVDAGNLNISGNAGVFMGTCA